MVAEELADELDVRGLAATGASAGELEERLCELAVLDVCLGVDERLFRGDVFGAVVPFLLFVELGFEGFHLEGLNALLAGAYVNAVGASEAVEDVDGLDEAHTLEGGSESGNCSGLAHGGSGGFGLGEDEGTDGGVRAYICALVALDAVLFLPFGDEGCDAALFVAGGTLFPGAVGDSLESGYLEVVAHLSVDGADDVVDEGGVVVAGLFGLGELGPCGVDVELVVLTAAVYGGVVLVDNVLTFLAVALDDEFLHLLDGEVNGDYFGDAEECALEDGVRAVAEADFLSNLRGVDVVDGDVVLCEVALDVDGEVLCEFLAFPDCVEKECAALAEAAGHVVHVEVRLDVACHEVGGC